MTTNEYRTQQFEKVSTIYSEYKPKIKIVKPDGQTHWFDIEESELQEIKNILIK